MKTFIEFSNNDQRLKMIVLEYRLVLCDAAESKESLHDRKIFDLLSTLDVIEHCR